MALKLLNLVEAPSLLNRRGDDVCLRTSMLEDVCQPIQDDLYDLPRGGGEVWGEEGRE